MTRKCSLLLAVVMLTAASAAAQDAAAVLRAAATAMGTANMRSVQYSGTGWNAPMGQSYMPTEDWPRIELTSYTRVFDYDARYSREDWSRVQGNYAPRGGGGVPVYDWGAAVNGVWKQTLISLGDYAWNVDGTNITPGPRLSSSAAGMRPDIRQVDVWLSPHGFLKAGMTAKDATAVSLFLEGQQKTIVSFTVMNKFKLNGTITSDNLVERVQTWVPNPVFGDMVFEGRYTEYKDYNGVKFPGLIHMHQGDPRIHPGHNFMEIRVTSVQVNPNIQVPAVPDNVRNAPPPAVRIVSSQISPGVWRIAGEGHNSIAVEFRDFITVVEAPQDEMRSLGVMAEVRKLIPNKPIQYVVNTHHHFDHSGGLRTYVAQGATVVTHAANRNFYEQVFFYPSPRTLEPDLLSSRYPWFAGNRVPAIEGVTTKYVISDGSKTLDVYALQGVDESNMLVAYLPAERILINADLYSPPAPTAKPGRVSTAMKQFAANITRLKLNVDRHAGIHGDVGPHSQFLATMATAEKSGN
jgi:glyoxylase-like metal-dependent hydrolase (beta-lactamase superfamily II)